MLTALYPERRCGPKRRGGSGYGRGLLVLLAAFTASLVWTGAASAAPTCQDLSVTTLFQTPVTVTLVCMDPDYPVSYSIPPAETRVSLAGDKATFTPPPGAAGQTSFTYFGYNSIGATAIGTVRVTILPPPLPPPSPGPPPNRPPAAHCDSYSVKPGEVVDLPTPGVLANDSDPDGDRLRVEQADDIDGRFPSPFINHNGALRFEVPTKVRMLSYRYVATDGALHSESTVTFWIGTKDRGCRPAFDPPPTSEPNLTWTLLKAGGAVRIRVGGSWRRLDGRYKPKRALGVDAREGSVTVRLVRENNYERDVESARFAGGLFKLGTNRKLPNGKVLSTFNTVQLAGRLSCPRPGRRLMVAARPGLFVINALRLRAQAVAIRNRRVLSRFSVADRCNNTSVVESKQGRVYISDHNTRERTLLTGRGTYVARPRD